jgi:hypothetical protein
VFVVVDDGLGTTAWAAKQQDGQQEWEQAAHVVGWCYALRAPILHRHLTGRQLRTPAAETLCPMLSIAEVSIIGQAISVPLEPFRRTPLMVFVTWRRALLGIAR